MGRVLLWTVVVGLGIAGCGPQPVVQVLDGDGVILASAPIVNTEIASFSVSPNTPPAALRLRAPSDVRAILFRNDWTVPFDPIGAGTRILEFPATTAADPQIDVPITEADRNWRGVRTYDLGECSLSFSFRSLDFVLAAALPMALTGAGWTGVVARRIGTGARLVAGPSGPEDEMRLNGYFHADSVPRISCPIDISFESRYWLEELTATAARDLSCPGIYPTEFHQRFLNRLEMRAEVHDFCPFEGEVERGFVDALSAQLPGQFNALFAPTITFTTAELGLPTVPCTCDVECGTAGGDTALGPLSRCVGGSCNVVIDVDRTFVTPYGLQFVYTEDALDPQSSIMPAVVAIVNASRLPPFSAALGTVLSCDPTRAPIGERADRGEVNLIPATFDPSEL